VALLDDEEVADAALLEPDGHPETTEAGADHEEAHVPRQGCGCHADEPTDGIERTSIALLKIVQ
jgi:hypothetical protein